MYNTFFLLEDNYRVLTIYKDVKKYLPELTDDEWRDVEMKYARVSAQKGEIDTKEFSHITKEDGILLEAIARACKCANLIENVTANVPAGQISKLHPLAQEIRAALHYLENAVRRINRADIITLYVQMIRLYGHGMLMFEWNKKEKLASLYRCLSEYADSDVLESVGNFIFEMDAPIEESIKRFTSTFERNKNIHTWQELNLLYIRHGMLDRADAMYRELFSKRKELIEEGPEYAYRAFIDYIMLYRRDLKLALQCYIDAKDAFKDKDIGGFWELELMKCSGSFNDPERFEIERRQFVEKGLVTEEAYHSAAFIAHLANLNDVEAIEHNNYIRQQLQNPKMGMMGASKEEILFLNWIGEIKPSFIPHPDSMLKERATVVRENYEKELWHRTIDKQFKNQFRLRKSIAIDAWSLYQLAERGILDDLQCMDFVFVSHLSVLRLLEELSRTGNQRIRIILNYLKVADNIQIYSAGFKAQLDVRNVTQYSEPASTVAVAVEKDCIVIYGEPIVDKQLIEHFGNRIVRVSELDSLLGED